MQNKILKAVHMTWNIRAVCWIHHKIKTSVILLKRFINYWLFFQAWQVDSRRHQSLITKWTVRWCSSTNKRSTRVSYWYLWVPLLFYGCFYSKEGLWNSSSWPPSYVWFVVSLNRHLENKSYNFVCKII